MTDFLNLDPGREHRLEKQLAYAALDSKKFESDADFENWVAATRRKCTISGGGQVVVNARGEQILRDAGEEYAPIRAAREAARVKKEREEAVSEVVSKWAEEKTPLTLISSGPNPELAMATVTKFSGFGIPGPYVLLRGAGFRRKIALSSEWAVVQEGETISCDPYQLTARAVDTDQIEGLFSLPAADLVLGEAK